MTQRLGNNLQTAATLALKLSAGPPCYSRCLKLNMISGFYIFKSRWPFFPLFNQKANGQVVNQFYLIAADQIQSAPCPVQAKDKRL